MDTGSGNAGNREKSVQKEEIWPWSVWNFENQGIREELQRGVEEFCRAYGGQQTESDRVQKPEVLFFGQEILEMAIAALLEGENLLLTGEKATGKNVLAETLAWIFERPAYTVSFHVNMGSAELIGTDTFRNNEVTPVREAFRAAPEQEDLGFSMRSIWRKMMR